MGVGVGFCEGGEREDFRDGFASWRHFRCHYHYDHGCLLDRGLVPQAVCMTREIVKKLKIFRYILILTSARWKKFYHGATRFYD